MKKADIVFKVLGLATTIVFGTISAVMELKKTTKISEKDKDDIAKSVVKYIIIEDEKMLEAQRKKQEEMVGA